MWKWEADTETPRGVIVIVHGASEHHGRYKWLRDMWRFHGFHVIMGDLPGQGTTTRRLRGHIKSFDEYINEIKVWIDAAHQYGLPVFLLGHSMGGLAVVRTLQEKEVDVKCVILSSPCLGLVKNPPFMLDMCTKGLNHLIPTLRVNAGLSVYIATRNEEVREMDANDSLYVTKVSVRWYRELVKAMKLAQINQHKIPDLPFLVMQGGDDKIVNKVEVRKWFDRLHVNDKTYKEWPKLYHEIFNGPEREDVFQFTKSFLDTHIEVKIR